MTRLYVSVRACVHVSMCVEGKGKVVDIESDAERRGKKRTKGRCRQIDKVK